MGWLSKRKKIRQQKLEKGFIIVQVDALSYNGLVQAMEQGYMPFLKKLLGKGYNLKEYDCGLLSNTSSAQAGIMYGNDYDVPATAWYDKKTGKIIDSLGLNDAIAVEEKLGKGGLLNGGTSYVNIFSGGADKSTMTCSTVAKKSFKQQMREGDFALLFLLSPWVMIKTLSFSVLEFLFEFAERTVYNVEYYFTKRRMNTDFYFYPFRILNNVFFREVATFGAMTDINKGVNPIYLTFCGYDIISHYKGIARSRNILKAIDTRIMMICHAAKKSKRRKYDVIILSDHGSVDSVPFEDLYKESIGDFIKRKIEKDIMKVEMRSSEAGVGKKKPFVMKDVRDQLIVVPAGNVCNVYFNFAKDKIGIKEIEKIYPGLVDAIFEHKGIGAVVGKDAVFSKSKIGVAVKKQMKKLANMETSGDLIIFGGFNGKQIISFKRLFADHGGFAGEQTSAFMMYPGSVEFDSGSIKSSKDLYGFFKKTFS